MTMNFSNTSPKRARKTLAASRQWHPDASGFSRAGVRHRRAGFTLVEAVISILLVGMTLVTAMSLAGVSGKGQIGAFQQRRGRMLARELLIEVQSQSYIDPDLLEKYWNSIVQIGSITLSGGDNFGPAVSETTGNRSLFDDVDDYNGWNASPPQDKDGTARSDLTDWTRSVVVERMNPTGLAILTSLDMGLRRITVTASYKGGVVASVMGFKSAGLPPLEACCECNEPCADLPVSICEARGGTPQGFGTSCSVDTCYLAKVAVVTKEPDSLTTTEQDRYSQLESLDFLVTTIEDEDTAGNFNALAAEDTVFYLTKDANISDIGSKLTNVTSGVLTECESSFDVLGFSDQNNAVTDTEIDVSDNTHYITMTFPIGTLQIGTSMNDIQGLKGTLGTGVAKLANKVGDTSEVSLASLDTGDTMYGGGAAAGRRVKLPWSDNFDMSDLSANGLTILERSVLWAAGCEEAAVCGDGTCELGETSCSCAADCGAPPAIETVLVNCSDGLDNDCDGDTDCDDPNCASDGTCLLATCGNGICEAGEDCNNCADCPGVSTGPALLQYCCGDGIAAAKEKASSLCDGNY